MNSSYDRPSIWLYLPLILGVAAAIVYAVVVHRDELPFGAETPASSPTSGLPLLKPSSPLPVSDPSAVPVAPTPSTAPARPTVASPGAPPTIRSQTPGALPPRPPDGQQPFRLFFRDGKTLALGEETRYLPQQENMRLSLAAAARAWFSGPQTAALAPMFPNSVKVLATFVTRDNDAAIDIQLPPDFAFAGGAAEECLALAALGKTVLENFSEIRSLRILIDGKARPTLAGHIDIDRSWNRAELADLVPVPE